MPIHGWELQIYLKSSQVVVYETEESSQVVVYETIHLSWGKREDLLEIFTSCSVWNRRIPIHLSWGKREDLLEIFISKLGRQPINFGFCC